MREVERTLVWLAAGGLAIGCGGSGADADGNGGFDEGITESSTDAEATDEDAEADADSDVNDGDPEVVELRIEPPMASIQITNDVIPPATQFSVYGKLEGGQEVLLSDAQWSFSDLELATVVPATGALTATGAKGGVGTIRATYGAISAEAPVDVFLKFVYDPELIPDGIKDAFDSASLPDPALTVLYPYDQTVFPLGLAGPVLQWAGADPGNVMRFRVDADYASYEIWGTAQPPFRHSFPAPSEMAPNDPDVWLKLTVSTSDKLDAKLQRLVGATAYLPIEHSWTIAQANLTGLIYYWEVNNGKVVRLEPGGSSPEDFLTPPPPYPGNNVCVACHSVSADGSTIVASRYGGYSPWGTWQVDGSPIFFTGGSDPVSAPPSGFQAISPNGDWIIHGQSQQNGAMYLSAKDSQEVLATLTVGAGNPVHPAWSPDGSKVAFGVRTDGNWLDFNVSSLWVANVSTDPPGFSNPMQIVNTEGGKTCMTFPSFSPDSQWVVFNKSNMARTRGATSDLWMVKANGVVQLQLARANGAGAIPPEQQQMNAEPTFMPVEAGGYFWVVFGSERQYGNTLLDQNPATRVKQLWVAAIDAVPGLGDPSHPAFWLPGQELNNQNMRGFWALAPCKELGQDCNAGFDCCTGYCSVDGVCTDDVPQCSPIGSACETAADCCDPSAMCIGGFCQYGSSG